MSREPIFKSIGCDPLPGYGVGYDDGYAVGGRQLALFREYFNCHQTMNSTVKPEEFATAAARANELRGILSGFTP